MELLPTLKTCTENVMVFGRVHGFLRYIRDRLTDEQTSGVDETDIGLQTDRQTIEPLAMHRKFDW